MAVRQNIMTRKVDLNHIPPVNLPRPAAPKKNKAAQESFQDVFKKATGVKFSSHAMDRIKSRNIQLGQEDMEKITRALDLAGEKGSKEALLVCEEMVLIASVKNRTVISAVDKENLKERVFTNIDSAVIVK